MLATSISRGQFLRGDFRGRQTPIRPPWALSESQFVELCTRCGSCGDACPHQIVATGSGGFPKIDFSRGECTFCGECVAACRDGALSQAGGRRPWRHAAAMNDRCLALGRIVCRSCADVCEAGAIRFRLRPGGVPTPRVEVELCSGCGACFGVCPVGAIEMRPAPQAAA
jgi:ferredoxin-type protein NapF